MALFASQADVVGSSSRVSFPRTKNVCVGVHDYPGSTIELHDFSSRGKDIPNFHDL